MPPRVAYIANARLPTEKAHGFQICKMCEAFSDRGAGVVLLHPSRRQRDPSLRDRDVFEFYGLRRVFEVRRLANLDVMPLNAAIPDAAFAPVVLAQGLLWGRAAVAAARREDPDLYMTRDVEAAWWLVRAGLPTVLEIHVMPRRARLRLLRDVCAARSLKLVVVLTAFLRQAVVTAGLDPGRAIVLADAVDPSWFDGVPARDVCRRELALPQDSRIVGYVGRFQTLGREKGIPELVQAMGRLNEDGGIEASLACVGGPMDAVPGYRARAREAGLPVDRMRFVDRVPRDRVPGWIRACDVVTIPWPWTEFSAHFTSPLKLFEYMASGVPIVATDLPALREVLRHGENAWLVAPGDAAALADGLRVVLSDPSLAARLAARAREDVSQHTWTARAEAVLRSALSPVSSR